MMDALGALVITFFAMSFVSILGILFMFLMKNDKVKKGIFYFLSVWGMIVAYCNVRSTPSYMTGSLLLAFGLGALAVAGLLVQLCMKKEKSFLYAQILTTVSVVAGMVDLFMI